MSTSAESRESASSTALSIDYQQQRQPCSGQLKHEQHLIVVQQRQSQLRCSMSKVIYTLT